MAQCKQNAQEYTQDAFAPMVAVLCSHDAELLCQKNNLTFTEMIQPFCRLTSEAHIRDPGNIPHTVHNLRIQVRDINVHPPNPAMARKMMSDAVANAQPQMMENTRNSVISVGDYDLQLSMSTQWYEAYRDCFMHITYPSDHEFHKHFLACIFVVSSSHADPMDQFSKLTQQQHVQQHQQPHNIPKWFCPNVFRFYVLLHDVVEGDEPRAEAIYQNMKSTYGLSACHLLQVNSRSLDSTGDNLQNDQASMPNPWSQFMSRKISELQDGEYDTSTQNLLGEEGKMEDGPLSSHPPDGATIQPQSSVEAATEATEEETGVQPQSSIVIDHPLADDSIAMDTTNTINEDDVDNRIPRDSQNNPITMYSREKQGSKQHQQHGECLSLSDHDRLRIFIHEFMVRGLVPWAERTLRTLNEQLTSRKGIHRSLFSATKKWFGGKPGVPATAAEKANVVYTSEAPEMQMRRMADLAFMFQLYEIAYQTYHTAKRDFNNDHAWLYYAGALEMACMSVFMQGNASQRQYPHHYMESAVTTYLNTCKSPQFATRATMLSTEALKSKGMYAEAAMQFIKMTSEDSDLRSALLLEQAAHCFINMKKPMVRKYAFHMILAGHRFSKAGQRKHALRSYSQALQVYKGKSWSLAEDHINFTIGRQSFNLKHLDNATAAFKHLLTLESKQSPPQQSAFLREYLFVYKQQLTQHSLDGIAASELPQLPLPVVDGNITKVLLGTQVPQPEKGCKRTPASSVSFMDADDDMREWKKLEEMMIISNNGTLPLHFRPSIQCFTNKTNNTASPTAVLSERVTVQVRVFNPLRIQLVLTDVVLLWKFVPSSQDHNGDNTHKTQVISNHMEVGSKNKLADELIDTEMKSEILLEIQQEQEIELSLTPHAVGELHIIGLAYNLGTGQANTNLTPVAMTNNPSNSNTLSMGHAKPSFISSISVRGCLNLEVQGPRLNATKEEKTSKMYGPDCRLDLSVVPSMPQLQVFFDNMPRDMLCGEVQQVFLELKNVGSIALHRVKVASTHPDFFTLSDIPERSDNCSTYQTLANSSDTDSEEFPLEVTPIKHVIDIDLVGGQLKPNEALTLPMWIRGPEKAGDHVIKLLFYYESTEKNPKLKHRVLRHTAKVSVHNSVGLKAVATRGNSCQKKSSNNHLNSVNVTLEVENLNQVQDLTMTEVSILQVSCVSHLWHLHHLSTQRHSDIKVSSRESVLIAFKARKCKHHCAGSGKDTMVFTNVTFDQHQIHSCATPCADFYFRARALQSFDSVQVLPPNPALQIESISSQDKRDMFEDVEKALDIDLTLIVLWRAYVVDDDGENRVIMGQHHVTLASLNTPVCCPPPSKSLVEHPPVKIIKDPVPNETVLPSTDAVSQLIKYSFHYTHTLNHNFTKSRLCVVGVSLQIHNCSQTDVIIDIDASKHQLKDEDESESSKQQQQQQDYIEETPSASFTWAGQTLSQVNLEAGQELSLKLQACFCKPGVYNLGELQVLAKPKLSFGQVTLSSTLQKPTGQSLIVIT